MAKKSENKSFVLRVDAATMDALERWADDEFRSINGQLQWIIADALRRSGRLKKVKTESKPTEQTDNQEESYGRESQKSIHHDMGDTSALFGGFGAYNALFG